MGDGSGCLHENMKKSFIVPTSMECAKCGKPELYILRYSIGSLEQDKLELIKLTHNLQDVIAVLKNGLKGDYDLDMWIDWAIDKRAMQERIAELEAQLKTPATITLPNAEDCAGRSFVITNTGDRTINVELAKEPSPTRAQLLAVAEAAASDLRKLELRIATKYGMGGCSITCQQIAVNLERAAGYLKEQND